MPNQDLEPRLKSLEDKFGVLMEQQAVRDQRDEKRSAELFLKIDRMAEASDHKREEMSASLESKIDGLERDNKPDRVAFWTAAGVVIAFFSLMAGLLMFGVLRELAHGDDRMSRLERIQDGRIALDLEELRQRRMNQN